MYSFLKNNIILLIRILCNIILFWHVTLCSTNDNEVVTLENGVEYYPLTHPQKGIWYTEKMYPGTSIGNIAATLKIREHPDLPLLQKAINLLIQNHDAFRLHFKEIDGEPVQYITDFRFRQIDFYDFSKLGLEALYNWDSQQTQTPFSLIDSDLYYFAIVKISEEEFGIYSKLHHLISDGWSVVHAGNDVIKLYIQLRNEPDNAISIESKSYVDYIHNEQAYEISDRFVKDKDYWESQFTDLNDLYTLKQSTANSNLSAKRKTFVIPVRLSSKIREFCKGNNSSIFSLFLSALGIYINRTTAKDDIIIGVPVLNRSNVKEKETLGMFVSTIPLRIKIENSLDFLHFMSEINNKWYSSLKHQKFPYEYILKSVREKNKNIEKLYDIALSYQNAKFVREEDNNRQEGRWHFNGCQNENLYIHINDREDDGNIILDFDFKEDLFMVKEIEFIYDHIIRILWHALDNPARQLKNVEMISEKEKQKIVNEFNDNKGYYSKELTVCRLFEKQVKKTPDSIAVVCDNKTITYADLNRKANQLARFLQEQNVGSDTVVGIMMNRSIEMMVAILAVLKAGGAYLPIDPGYPKNRIDYMLGDSNAAILLVNGNEYSLPAFDGVICNIDKIKLGFYKDNNAKNNAGCSSLAYVIYTSGSTGNPKGVMVENGSLVNLIYSMLKRMDFLPGKSFLSITTICFDIFFVESIIPLLTGMRVIMADESQQKDPNAICSLVKRYGINMLQATPTRMLSIVNAKEFDELDSLSEIIIGGETFPEALLKKLKQKTGARIFNGYGPTETTVYVTMSELTESKTIDIGKPLDNTQVYILDKEKNLLPIGIPGDLYIGGDCLSRGYINNKSLTNERFVNNPFAAGKLIYKTGDTARWYPKGDIEHLGRSDNQVKIRGFRIELGEIEQKLLNIESVTEAAVICKNRDDGSNFLCAYIVSWEKSVNNIKSILQKELPSYMIPSFIIVLDQIPKTPNGKIDRKSLPDPVYVNGGRLLPEKNDSVSSTELVIKKVWYEVLRTDNFDNASNFFDIGGDSLLAIGLISKINEELGTNLNVNVIFDCPTISSIANFIDTNSQAESEKIIPVEYSEYYPVSFSQQGLFLIDNLGGSSTEYNMTALFRIEGRIERDRIREALTELCIRHESLRTCFVVNEGTPVQHIEKELIPDVCFSTIAEAEVAKHVKNAVRPYDLSKAPLFRAHIFSSENDRHYLLLDFHHIIADGESINILLKDFISIYNGTELPELPVQYKDYSVWQRNMIGTGLFEKQKEYWLRNFSDEIPLLNLPYDYARPSYKSIQGDYYRFGIEPDLTVRIKSLAKNLDCTMFMLLLASYNILLHKYSTQNDIIVGTPYLGRPNAELKNIVGMFVNTLAIRSVIDPDSDFAEYMRSFKDVCINAYNNADYPFSELVSKLKTGRSTNRNPLFDTLFSLKNYSLTDFDIDGTRVFPQDIKSGNSKFDISFEAEQVEDRIFFNIEYCSELFKKGTIAKICEHYVKILEEIAADPRKAIKRVDLLTPVDHSMLSDFNNTEAHFPRKTIDQLFDEQVSLTPDNTAVVFKDRRYTYRQLNNKANLIAKALRMNGVANNSIVGVMLPRGFEYVTCILGIIKAGGAYLPIDKSYPAERIRYMISDSAINIILTDDIIALDFFVKGTVLDIKNYFGMEESNVDFTSHNSPDNLLYAIYTSGSTGNPKAVLIEHKNIVNLIFFEYLIEKIEFRKVLQFASLSFDVSAQEIFSTLLCGGELYIIDEQDKRDVNKFFDILNINSINTIFLPPSFLKQILSDESNIGKMPKSLRNIIVAGEQLIITETMKKYLCGSDAVIHNHYGPSETHVATTYTVNANNIPDLPPIGRPISNTRIYILNSDHLIQPAGVAGELYIAGECVGRGYLNNEALTGEKYLQDICGEKRIYKTGDLARWLPDGNIEFLGRLDNQVKIHGFRIELGEIEKYILNYEGVREAVVISDNDSNNAKYLVAFYVSDDSAGSNMVRKHLSSKMPQYMIPRYIIKTDIIPMTPNGKIDRKALVHMYKSEHGPVDYIPPQNDTQKIIVDLWKETLGIDNISIADNFFDLGGDSLSLIRLQIKAMKYNWKLTTQDYYSYQTVKELAEKIDGSLTEAGEQDITKGYEEELLSVNFAMAEKNRSSYLITGATGFLGVHILKEIISRTNNKIICIVRGKDGDSPQQRLYDTLLFYFGRQQADNIIEKAEVFNGDISQRNLGLDSSDYEYICENTSCIINAAALVKHYGAYNDFKNINIEGVKNLIKICIENGIVLNHMSTIGVFGVNYLPDCHDSVLTENDLDIGQSGIDNYYIKSKYEAEVLLRKYSEKGLTYNVFRVGNLTGRYSDGVFQKNIGDNAFYNRIKSFVNIGYISSNYTDFPMDFSPVDICSQAVLKIINARTVNKTYHIYNNNYLKINKLINYINKYGCKVEIVPESKFSNILKKLSEDEAKSNALMGIVQDLNDSLDGNNSGYKTTSKDTVDFLKELDFIWPDIDYGYIKKILDYAVSVNFLSLDDNPGKTRGFFNG